MKLPMTYSSRKVMYEQGLFYEEKGVQLSFMYFRKNTDQGNFKN